MSRRESSGGWRAISGGRDRRGRRASNGRGRSPGRRRWNGRLFIGFLLAYLAWTTFFVPPEWLNAAAAGTGHVDTVAPPPVSAVQPDHVALLDHEIWSWAWHAVPSAEDGYTVITQGTDPSTWQVTGYNGDDPVGTAAYQSVEWLPLARRRATEHDPAFDAIVEVKMDVAVTGGVLTAPSGAERPVVAFVWSAEQTNLDDPAYSARQKIFIPVVDSPDLAAAVAFVAQLDPARDDVREPGPDPSDCEITYGPNQYCACIANCNAKRSRAKRACRDQLIAAIIVCLAIAIGIIIVCFAACSAVPLPAFKLCMRTCVGKLGKWLLGTCTLTILVEYLQCLTSANLAWRRCAFWCAYIYQPGGP